MMLQYHLFIISQNFGKQQIIYFMALWNKLYTVPDTKTQFFSNAARVKFFVDCTCRLTGLPHPKYFQKLFEFLHRDINSLFLYNTPNI